MGDQEKKGQLEPSYEALMTKASQCGNLRIEWTKKGDILSAVTVNHRYAFVVLDPERRWVRMTSDHPEFPGPNDGYLHGSLLAPLGSSILMGRIAIGLSLLFSTPDWASRFLPPEIRTTPVREVHVNGQRVLPAHEA